MSSVRPSIYIGIGGTGINAIAKTKKLFEDAYGKENLPNLPVRFVCLDYDKSAATNPQNATDISDDFIKIDNISNPMDLYYNQSRNGKYKWFYPQNAQFMDNKVTNGAAQVRGYGRFLTEMILPSIEAKLTSAYNNVTSIQQKLTDETTQIKEVDCHIVMSIAGGTGCGSFLNVAWALRKLKQSQVNIIGYGVLHSVFRAMDISGNQTKRVVSNAYSAILDLDYLMSANLENPINITMNGQEEELRYPLFNQFYVIDNVTENGKTVKDCSSLCEVISNCLFVAGGAIGSEVSSTMSNDIWTKGRVYNISPKNGWVQSLGACQIIYNGEALADIYADKASIELIRQFLNSDTDMSQKAIAWTEIAKIREDGDEYNYLTDRIYSPEQIAKIKLPSLDIKDALADTKMTVDKYLSTIPEFPTDKQVSEIKDNIIVELKHYADQMINNKNGVGNTKQFLTNLRTLCVGYKAEMEHEKQELENSATQTEDNLKQRGYKEFDEINKKFLKGREAKAEALEGCVSKPAQKILKLKAEAKRRACAYDIFGQLISEIDGLLTRVTTLEDRLKKFSSDITNELLRKQKASTGKSTFQIDLSASERVDMSFIAEDVNLSDFIHMLPTSLLDEAMSMTDLAEYIKHYTRNEKLKEVGKDGQKYFEPISPAPFAQYNTYREKLLDQVIAEMRTSNPNEYDKLKDEIDNYASRLLPIDDRGLLNEEGKSPSQLMVNLHFICHYGQKDNMGQPIKITFENDRLFNDDNRTHFLPSDSDYFKQRMIVYRTGFAVIPYCIKALDIVAENEYSTFLKLSNSDSSDKPHPHFDKLLFEEMKEKDFKLKPEIKNEALFYWVCGGILDFGWKTTNESVNIMQKDADGKPIKLDHKEDVDHIKYIRFYKGKYQYWNEAGAAAGGDKWVTINTADRRNAYDRFKTEILPNIKSELNRRILDQIRSNGIGFYEQRLKELIHDERGEVRASFDYIDIYAVGNKNSSTLYAGRTQEAAQYDEEWNYIVNELLNTLKNLK